MWNTGWRSLLAQASSRWSALEKADAARNQPPTPPQSHSVAIGIFSRGSTHHDHLCILSYKTLDALCRRAGFASWEIVPYGAAFAEMRARNQGLRGAVVGAGERFVNAIESAVPALSFGFVVRATI